jgi:hypothetical protein
MRMRYADSVTLFFCIWLFSNVALSNGSIAPELPLLVDAKDSAEYPLIKRLQELTLDLQLLEITVKNRRDSKIEDRINTSINQIESDGSQMIEQFRASRQTQLDGLYSLLILARRFGHLVGVRSVEWDELYSSIQAGQFGTGKIVVHSARGTLNVFALKPLSVHKNLVWQFELPLFDQKSFWVQLRAKLRSTKSTASAFSNAALQARVDALNLPYQRAESQAKQFYSASYTKLYSAFEEHRYAVLQRISLARKALVKLSRTAGAMGTPEEYALLYNRMLDNLFSYGVRLSLSGTDDSSGDFTIKGFLFSNTPEHSQELLEKLKFKQSEDTTAYTSASS